jgi:hypothetical protein
MSAAGIPPNSPIAQAASCIFEALLRQLVILSSSFRELFKIAHIAEGGFPSMNGHVNPFAVTTGAFVGACFPPMLGCCRHHDSHFLRALYRK